MSSSSPVLITLQQAGNESAIVFIHGFGGDAQQTWGEFPNLLKNDPHLTNWDVFSIGYSSRLQLDLWAGIWSADPDIPKLALFLNTVCSTPPLDHYQSLTLIAHSMGGLVVQQALANYKPLSQRVSHVFLFGTPSGGLKKASLFEWVKRQVQDMALDGAFIQQLRQRWDEQYSRLNNKWLPFKLWVVAGDRDEFVPANSSLEAFSKEKFPQAALAVVPGNHLQIVKPENAQNLSVQVVIKGLKGRSDAAGAWNGAAIAVEFREFQKAIDLLEPHQQELDEAALVQLALALEGVGRGDEALAVLESRNCTYTDAMGVLAGRLKRRWLVERREGDARRAMDLYVKAFDLAKAAGDHEQAYYHGINVAFMVLAYEHHREKAKEKAAEMAEEVLIHCAQAQDSHWKTATQGEAYLMLGREQEALAYYKDYIAIKPKPRDLESTYQQAKKVADLLGSNKLLLELDKIFVAY